MIFETGFWTVSVEDDTGLSRGECGGPAEAVVIPDCGENPASAGRVAPVCGRASYLWRSGPSDQLTEDLRLRAQSVLRLGGERT